jgi:hypothetical protein
MFEACPSSSSERLGSTKRRTRRSALVDRLAPFVVKSATLGIGIVRPACGSQWGRAEAVSLMPAMGELMRAVMRLKRADERRNPAIVKVTRDVISFAFVTGALDPRGPPPAIAVASL